ncbi:hypothetical protein N9O61_01875 [Octadecabacter sp.]|nr:hypothetical protein [Octadecabacter sp.]
MPQADLKYTTDLEFDALAMMADIEALIARHDSGAGACKARAYPATLFQHTHFLLELAILNKPHRDAAFRKALVADLTALVDGYLPKGTERAVELIFASEDYAPAIVG